MTEFSRQPVVRIFLGSPGDVQDERDVAFKVVGDVNKWAGRNLDVHIDLVGWEDIPRGRPNRPQDAINEELSKCDVFLGIVWQRWGSSPGGDDNHTSGFEEEFDTAVELHDQGQMDEVFVFFKEMSDDQRRDPGQQARQVLDFRDSIKQDQEVFFGVFSDTREWWRMCYNHLIEYLTRKFTPTSSEESSHARRRDAIPEDTDVIRVDTSLEAVLLNVEDTDEDELTPLRSARANLYTESLVYGSVYPDHVVGAEKLIYLYHAKEHIELDDRERLLILRTLVADKSQIKPGWYWIDVEEDQLSDILTRTARHDPLDIARSRARGLLRSVSEEEYRQVVRQIIADGDIEEISRALGPFVEDPQQEDTNVLRNLVDEQEGDVAETAWRGELILRIRNDASRAIEWIIDTPDEQRGKYNDLLPTIMEEADSDQIRQLLTVESGKNRAKAVEALREELADGELRELAQDENLDVAAVALMELIERGDDVDDRFINDQLLPQRRQPRTSGVGIGAFLGRSFLTPRPSIYSRRDVLRALYRTWGREQLEEGIEWTSNGALRYQVLMEEHHDAHGDRLRADIQNEFQRYETRPLEAIIQGQDPDQDDSFTLGCFYRAAFQVLASHTRPDDVETARDFLREPHDSTFTRKIIKDAFKIIAQHGGPDDIDLVWGYVTHDNIEIRRQATALVLNLGPQRFQEHASALLNLDDWEVQKIVFRSALENEEELPRELVRQLLYSSESQTRRGALAYLVENMEEAEQRELLNNYPQAEDIDFDFYYYDVVGWLDRVLFAPEPIRDYYREELTDTLNEANSLTFTD